MTTFRIRHQRNYTTIQNSTIQDSSLSFRARGIHHLLLSYPNDWIVNEKHLVSQSPTEGRDAIRSALKELEGKGYLARSRKHGERGRFIGTDYDVFEIPQIQTDDGLTDSGSTDDGSTAVGLTGDGKSDHIQRNIYSSSRSKDLKQSTFSYKAEGESGERAATPTEPQLETPASLLTDEEVSATSRKAGSGIESVPGLPHQQADPFAANCQAAFLRARVCPGEEWNESALKVWASLWEKSKRSPGDRFINLKSYIRKNLNPKAGGHGGLLDEWDVVRERLDAAAVSNPAESAEYAYDPEGPKRAREIWLKAQGGAA